MMEKSNVQIDHVKKTVTILTKKLSNDDNILVADLVSRGYSAEVKGSKQSGRNRKWYRDQLPDDSARAQFDEMCDKRKGLGGWRVAVQWAKEVIVSSQLPDDSARAEFEKLLKEDSWTKARAWAKDKYKVEI